MSFLMLYHPEQSRQPSKLLNHAEDITATLAGWGIGFRRVQGLPRVNLPQTNAEVPGAVQEYLQSQGLSPDGQLLSCQPLPMGAQVPALVEQWHPRPQAFVCLSGRGLFLVQAGEAVLALVAEAGDWLELPADTRYAFDGNSRSGFLGIALGQGELEVRQDQQQLLADITRLEDFD